MSSVVVNMLNESISIHMTKRLTERGPPWQTSRRMGKSQISNHCL